MERFPNFEDEREEVEKIKALVSAEIEELSAEGYKFEFREEGDEFILKLNGSREIHFPVWQRIPVMENKGDKPINYPIQDIIRKSVIDFAENGAETVDEPKDEDMEESK